MRWVPRVFGTSSAKSTRSDGLESQRLSRHHYGLSRVIAKDKWRVGNGQSLALVDSTRAIFLDSLLRHSEI